MECGYLACLGLWLRLRALWEICWLRELLFVVGPPPYFTQSSQTLLNPQVGALRSPLCPNYSGQPSPLSRLKYNGISKIGGLGYVLLLLYFLDLTWRSPKHPLQSCIQIRKDFQLRTVPSSSILFSTLVPISTKLYHFLRHFLWHFQESILD